jgi:signal transduction histidine kinase
MATSIPSGTPVARRDYDRLARRTQLLEEQVRALIVLQNVANTVSGEADLPVLLRKVAMAAVRMASGTASALYLIDPRGESLLVEAVETRSEADRVWAALDSASPDGVLAESAELPRTYLPIPLGQGIAGQVATTAIPLVINEFDTDTRFAPEVVALDTDVLEVQPAALACVPLIFKGRVTGVLEVAQTPPNEGFDARDLDMLATLGAQAATAVASARLYQNLRGERDRIISIQEEVRKELARNLHDGPAQSLATIAMRLDFAVKLAQFEPAKAPGELKQIYELALRTSRDIRNLLFDLRPLVLESEGLEAALRRFLERFDDDRGPSIQFEAQYPTRLSHNAEAVIFAVVQEAVNNVLKHAHATNLLIDLRETPEAVTVLVRDDGKGFDITRVKEQYPGGTSFGMLNMRERAALVEATLKISSQPGRGTALLFTVPRTGR